MGTTIRFTNADVETLPDRLDDTRYEVIDGELSVASQPHWEHQLVGTLLSTALTAWGFRTKLGVCNTAPGVVFSPEDGVAPDVIWISHERLARGLGADGKLHMAPELAIEILSPGSTNERRDRETKLKLYAREGVEEYWIADWRTRTVAVYRRSGDILAPIGTLTDADTLTSPLLPGFPQPLVDLWQPPHR